MTRLVLAFTFLLVSKALFAAEPISDSGKMTSVTVYQGHALVTREVSVAMNQGLNEVVVTDLPAQVMTGSLYAEPAGDAEIRSVRFRVRPVAEDTREEVRELDKQIQEISDQQAAVKAEAGLLASQTKYLQKLEDFTTRTAGQELTSGVLNATTLKDLTKTIFDGRADIAKGKLRLDKTSRELAGQMKLLTSKRQRLTSSSSRAVREAVVFLNAPKAGPASFRLTYLVAGATWSPSYNLRASADRTKVTVEYNASVQQQTGEDWTDVAMTLSTASPSLVATAPKLLPLPIRLAALAQKPQSEISSAQAYDEFNRRQQSLSKSRRSFAAVPQAAPNQPAREFNGFFYDGDQNVRGAAPRFSLPMSGGGGGGFGAVYGDLGAQLAQSDFRLNYWGNQIQVLECSSGLVQTKQTDKKSRSEEGISVVYELPNRTSLPSRADQQLIPIASLPLEGEFYRVARPVLTEYVYEEARVANDTDFVLLAGPAATFLGDRFVGRGAAPTVAIGESFTIGLGIDESLRASRELVEKDRRVQGGNQIVRLDYRLTIKNFGDAETTVRLYDRLPSADDAEVKVSLLDSSVPPVTEDPAERKQGILSWLVDAPAKDKSPGKVAVDYAMQLEHDRNRTIAEATQEP
ncbi:MAG: mucoidy inhibitor MuiA family protein [Planctomycetota bacterium]